MSYKSCLKSRNITALAVCMSLFAVLLFAGGCGKNIVPAKEPPASGTDDAAPADENEMPEPYDESPAEVEYRTKSYMDVICAASGIVPTDDGSFLVTDAYNKVVWMVRDGKSTVYAGGDTVEDLYGEPVGGYNDAEYEESLFSYPWAIAPFLGGWAVSDADNDALRLITDGEVQTINAKTKENLEKGDLGVIYSYPTGLAADDEGNLYVSDTHNGAIRKITENGKLTTITDGLDDPMGIFFKDGWLYVAETGANRIVKVSLDDGSVETVAGSGERDYADGNTDDAAFCGPQGVAADDDGTVYVSDTGNSAIRMIKDGEVTTIMDRDRHALELKPVRPTNLAIKDGTLYICDSFSRKVIELTIR